MRHSVAPDIAWSVYSSQIVHPVVRRRRGKRGVDRRWTRPAGCARSIERRWRPSLHCHLVWRRSPCGNFPLEPFACGLASKNAYDDAQRLVAAIVRRAPRCSASSQSVALGSRSDHNAAAPSEWSICASQAEHLCVRPMGHHVIAGDSAQPRCCQARSRVSGRSEAEWLDWAEDRRTIRCRDGRIGWPPGRSA